MGNAANAGALKYTPKTIRRRFFPRSLTLLSPVISTTFRRSQANERLVRTIFFWYKRYGRFLVPRLDRRLRDRPPCLLRTSFAAASSFARRIASALVTDLPPLSPRIAFSPCRLIAASLSRRTASLSRAIILNIYHFLEKL